MALKPKLKLKIVANNTNWTSWPAKIELLKQWFLSKVNLEIDIEHTSFQIIPFQQFGTDKLGKPMYGVENRWYDQYISKEAKGYDIVLLVLPVWQWRANDARGWRLDKDFGPVELQIACDETEQIWKLNDKTGQMESLGLTFLTYAAHEILHALFLITGQEDTTHKWRDAGDIKKALAEIEFPVPKLTDIPRSTLLQMIYDLLIKLGLLEESKKIKKLMEEDVAQTLQEKNLENMIDAISEMEGWW